MAGWSGFSDDDLRKMRQSNSKAYPIPGLTKLYTDTRTKICPDTTKKICPDTTTKICPDATTKICPDLRTKTKGNKEKSFSQVVDEVKSNVAQHTNDSKTNKEIVEPARASQSDLNGVKELDESEALSFERNTVQKFQIQQKVIEEANKHKRALLSKAIEDRRKQAKAEAEKLMKVQQELNHLDSLLTADVSIIRDKIEIASLEYNDAQKRYERAEKEFVVAKFDLFSKGEVKEQLTQHLYTIIHQNEVRKAKKLVELMEKLAMDVTPEEMELTIPAIPQLTNFTAVATLHDPHPAKGDNQGCNDGNVGAQKLSRADGLDGANVSKQDVNSSLPGAVSKEVESVSDLPPAAPAPDKVNVETRENQDGCAQVAAPTIEHSGANISSLISTDGAPDVNKNISPVTSEENVVELSKQQENVLAHCQENDVIVIGKGCQENEVICKDIISETSLVSSPLSSGRGWTHPFT